MLLGIGIQCESVYTMDSEDLEDMQPQLMLRIFSQDYILH
jgi:hypothetical protein